MKKKTTSKPNIFEGITTKTDPLSKFDSKQAKKKSKKTVIKPKAKKTMAKSADMMALKKAVMGGM